MIDKYRRLGKKQGLILVCLVGLLVVASVLAGMTLFGDDTPSAVPKVDGNPAFHKSQALKDSGDFDEAASYAAQQYDLATSPQEKYGLAMQAATSYDTAKLYPQAIEWYQKAETQMPKTKPVAAGLGRSYDVVGDKAKAAEYYQKAIDLVNKDAPDWKNDVAYYTQLRDKAKAAQ